MTMFCCACVLVLFRAFNFPVFSYRIHGASPFMQTILLDDVLINGRHYRIEDVVRREYDGSFFIQRVLKLTDIGPFAVASMVLEIPPEKQSAAELDTSLLMLNHSKILIPYTQAMAAAPFALEAVQLEKNDKVWNILDIGLGTGILNSFLHDVFNNMNITVVELEQGIYEIAKRYFGLIEDNSQRVIIEDGMRYLQKAASQLKFDVIFIDACYDRIVNELMCPVEAFALKENLEIIKQALTKTGVVVLSALIFEEYKFRQVQKNYTIVFGSCHVIADSLNLNNVLVCGEFEKNKEKFARKLKEIYKKFEFYSEPNIE
ncbi:unnamed protein product [Litomosoides sigmodontis]|uniref:Methyltransferase domain-containing protein n=1 Tax=Litomosoides sigmodontis TaxID=42156 RepID=A0A3P6SBQ2_LITSI|nr:unnamed protein product [Litomosoides sigmodontis]